MKFLGTFSKEREDHINYVLVPNRGWPWMIAVVDCTNVITKFSVGDNELVYVICNLQALAINYFFHLSNTEQGAVT
jgi:hypothetical protein